MRIAGGNGRVRLAGIIYTDWAAGGGLLRSEDSSPCPKPLASNFNELAEIVRAGAENGPAFDPTTVAMKGAELALACLRMLDFTEKGTMSCGR